MMYYNFSLKIVEGGIYMVVCCLIHVSCDLM